MFLKQFSDPIAKHPPLAALTGVVLYFQRALPKERCRSVGLWKRLYYQIWQRGSATRPAGQARRAPSQPLPAALLPAAGPRRRIRTLVSSRPAAAAARGCSRPRPRGSPRRAGPRRPGSPPPARPAAAAPPGCSWFPLSIPAPLGASRPAWSQGRAG